MQISDKKGITDTVSLFIEQISTWTYTIHIYTNSNQPDPFFRWKWKWQCWLPWETIFTELMHCFTNLSQTTLEYLIANHKSINSFVIKKSQNFAIVNYKWRDGFSYWLRGGVIFLLLYHSLLMIDCRFQSRIYRQNELILKWN